MADVSTKSAVPLSVCDSDEERSRYDNEFVPELYLSSYLSPENVSPLKKDTALKEIHELFKTYENATNGRCERLKVLDYGCGPCVHSSISAAGYGSDIVLAEYTEGNRQAVRRWLDRDPKAFNWSPYFDYVVQTLEGGTEQQAREREEELRSAVKAVVHCDVTQESPIEAGYEGPYDVILSLFCIETASRTPEEYAAAVSKLATLLKPGGVIGLYTIDRESTGHLVTYNFGGGNFYDLAVSADFVKAAVEQSGLCNVTMTRHPGRFKVRDPKDGMIGTVFVSAKKAKTK